MTDLLDQIGDYDNPDLSFTVTETVFFTANEQNKRVSWVNPVLHDPLIVHASELMRSDYHFPLLYNTLDFEFLVKEKRPCYRFYGNNIPKEILCQPSNQVTHQAQQDNLRRDSFLIWVMPDETLWVMRFIETANEAEMVSQERLLKIESLAL